MNFSKKLLHWYSTTNRRALPWRGIKNPYLIWLSEVILQQTRVDQGLPYFLRFKKQYPTVKGLALSSEDEVLKLWQGLGYYSRARNLRATARHVYFDLGGKFPQTFTELKRLKGIGDYTAAAIASFAFNEPKAVVDGNVIRVLARVFGIKTPFDTTEGKKTFAQLAQSLMAADHPADYNQAIMDFGAEVCLPRRPKCEGCIFQTVCVAYGQGLIQELPHRAKRTAVTDRYFNYFLVQQGGHILLHKRSADDIWKGLYELLLIESAGAETSKAISAKFAAASGQKAAAIEETMHCCQRLSHQKIYFRFYKVTAKGRHPLKWTNAIQVPVDRLSEYGFPKTVYLYLNKNSLL